jgi:hypothetical protein
VTDDGRAFRLNGGRFYQQMRTVRQKLYGPYWYCRSGWGKVTHLGGELPPDVQAAQDTQRRAADLLRRLEAAVGLLRRFVKGDAMTDPDRASLAALGLTIPDSIAALTQACAGDTGVVSRWSVGDTQRAAQEVLTTEERELLVRMGLGRLVCTSPSPENDTNQAEE